MAAIFQIRRGTTNESLTEGELYLHQGSGSLQFGSGSTNYNVLTLNAPVNGDVILTGNITASNAYFSGDVAISGNLFLGNATTDEITIGGEFQSNLIPNPTNTYSLGSSTKVWKEVHATSISGAIAATNGVISGSSQLGLIFEEKASATHTLVSGSSQVIGILSSLNTFSASTDISVANLNIFSGSQLNKDLTLATYTGSVETRFIEIGVVSGSLIDSASIAKSTNNTQDGRLSNIETFSGSINSKLTEIGVVSGSLIASASTAKSTNDSQDVSVTNLNSFSSSVLTQLIEIGVVSGSLIASASTAKTTNDTQNSRLSELEIASASLNIFSGSTLGRLSNLETTSGSHNSRLNKLEESTGSLNSFSSSTLIRLELIETSTGSLNSFSSSTLTRLFDLEESTASLNVFSSSTLNRLSNLESKSASVDISLVEIHAYTSSLKTAIDLSGQDVTVLGNLTVNGTTTQINSTQVNIGDNILELNFGGSSPEAGIYTKDATGVSEVSGSLLWDSADGADFWKAGKKGLESKILLAGGDSVISSSLQLTQLNSFTESTNTRLGLLETSTGSLNEFSSSTLNRLSDLEESTGSLNEFSESTNTRLNLIETSTGSLNEFTSSANDRLNDIEISTGSLNEFTSSANSRLQLIETSTGSLNEFTSSTHDRLDLIETSTGSLNTFSSSTLSRLDLIEQSTGSLNTFSSSTLDRLELIETSTGSLNEFTSSANDRLYLIEQSTGSLNTFTASANDRLNLIEQSTESLNTFTSSANSRLNLIETSTGSLNAFTSSANNRLNDIETSTGSLNNFTSSANSRLNAVETSTGSLNTFTSSANGRLDLIETSTGSLNTFTSSANSRLNAIEISTASLNVVTASLITSASQLYVSTSLMTASVEDHEERIGYLESIGGISGGNPLTQLHIFSASAKLSIAELEGPFSTSVDARINELSQSSGYINYITNSVENLTGIEVADFDNNVAVTFINGTLKFIFGTPAIPTSIATSLSGFESDRFNNVNDAYIVNGTWSNQGYTLVSASLYEGSALLTQVGSGTSLSFSTTTSGSHTYRLEYTASSPLDGTLFTTSTTTTGTISKSNPASPTLTVIPTVQLGASGNQIEQGATGSISFTSSSATPSNSWNLVNTTTNVSTPYFVTGSATGSTSISITATANYASPTGDNIPDLTTTSTATTTYTKIRSLRHGASTAESFTAGELENISAWDTTLGGNIGTIAKGTTTASGQSVTITWSGDKFHYIVFNSSLSNLTNITTSGFGVFGDFALTTVGQYKVYKSTTLKAGGAGNTITYTLT